MDRYWSSPSTLTDGHVSLTEGGPAIFPILASFLCSSRHTSPFVTDWFFTVKTMDPSIKAKIIWFNRCRSGTGVISLARVPELHNACTAQERACVMKMSHAVDGGVQPTVASRQHRATHTGGERERHSRKPTIVSDVSRFSCGGVAMAASYTGRYHHHHLLLLLFLLRAGDTRCMRIAVRPFLSPPVWPSAGVSTGGSGCAICPELGLSLFHCLKFLQWRLESATLRSHSMEEPKKETMIWSIYRRCWRMRWEKASITINNNNMDFTADVYCMFTLEKGKKPNSLLIQYVLQSCAICKL